jgi:hypothetical protein
MGLEEGSETATGGPAGSSRFADHLGRDGDSCRGKFTDIAHGGLDATLSNRQPRRSE